MMSSAHSRPSAPSGAGLAPEDSSELQQNLMRYMRKLKLNRGNLAFLLEISEARARTPAL